MREVSLEEWQGVHECHLFINETHDRYYVIDSCELCPDHVAAKEGIVEKVERRMKEYAEWTWQKLSNSELQRLPWDIKNRGFHSYADRKKSKV